jgi:23S rRNA G2069 N7-methylase RlmK/C1962 C5-methylase RlmI
LFEKKIKVLLEQKNGKSLKILILFLVLFSYALLSCYLTFSCSGLMEMDLFQKIIADAVEDAKRSAQIIERFGQPADHPVKTSFPEGQYLKGLLIEVE